MNLLYRLLFGVLFYILVEKFLDLFHSKQHKEAKQIILSITFGIILLYIALGLIYPGY